jgi:DNA-directed RNA polymerase specialized sigma54-like protein
MQTDPITQLAPKDQELVNNLIKELSDAGYSYTDMISIFREAQRMWEAHKAKQAEKNTCKRAARG